jgi:hypothetical protein
MTGYRSTSWFRNFAFPSLSYENHSRFRETLTPVRDLVRSTVMQHQWVIGLWKNYSLSSFQKIILSLISQPVRLQTEAQVNSPDDKSTNADAEVGLTPMFADSARFVPFTDMTVVDIEQTLLPPTYFCKRILSAGFWCRSCSINGINTAHCAFLK